MPSPVFIVGGVIIAVGAGIAFKQFVYDPYLSDQVHLWIEDFSQRRANRHVRLEEPHLASPTPRGKRSPADFMDEKLGPINDSSFNGAGLSTGREMREVSSVSNALRRRGVPFQRNNSELEMGVMGQSFPLTGLDSVAPTWQSPQMSDAARELIMPAGVQSPPPPALQSPPAITSPRSPFSDIRALSEISFEAPSSSDALDYQFSPPTEINALSPPAPAAAAPFSPFVLPHSPPNISADPFVDVPASQRPTSPWSEVSAHSGTTAGQLHLRLSRTDSDSEQDRRSDSGSDGSWEHT
ncbi:hypothetical protein FRC07_006441 [Ceratobasidium sp. 392]|nr:hypothetical protein FRC07_006441 [Ceratobasidium sp. 392]